ncbi:hypothetical protein D3C73_835410 [compost metagenome]
MPSARGHALFQGFIEVAQGFLCLFALGFVDHEDVETVDRTIGAVAGQVVHQGLAGAAVAVGRTDTEAAGFSRQRFGDVLGAQGVGVFAEHLKNGPTVKLLRRQAVPVQVSRIVQAKPFLAVDITDQDRHGVDDQLQLRLALAQCLFGLLSIGQVEGCAEETDWPAMVILVATSSGKHPAQLAVGLQQAIFHGVFAAVGDAVLDAAGDHRPVFGVHAFQVGGDWQLAGALRVHTVQLGEVAIDNESVFVDVPVPGAHRVGSGERQLQAFFGLALGLQAGGRALLQFEGNASAFVGFDGGDQDPGNLGAFIADGAVGQIQPNVGIIAVAVQGEALFAVSPHLAL